MDLESVRGYMLARDALRQHNQVQASARMAESLGLAALPPTIQNNLDALLDPTSLAGEAMLQLVLSRSARRAA